MHNTWMCLMISGLMFWMSTWPQIKSDLVRWMNRAAGIMWLAIGLGQVVR